MSSINELIAQLGSTDSAKRGAAAEQLARLEAEAQPAAVPLVEACAIDDAARDWVVTALEGLGPPAPADAGKLATLLGNPVIDVAYWAATLLGRLKADAASAVGPLAEALASHPEVAVRQRAAWALGQIGLASGAARAQLELAAAGSDPRLAALAREALANL